MQFKGTPRFPARVLDRAISRDGGVWNAFTWIDWTTYMETMPADRIDLALELEADRMQNSLFDPEEVESERTVIISEREGHENQPTFRLAEEMQAAAFRVHSYHHEVIGDMADLRTISREDLYAHYQRYYCPSNALLALAGDFSASTMIKRIRKAYGDLPKGPKGSFRARPEPEQAGERRVEVEGPGETAFVAVSFRAPAGDHTDFIALMVADSVLAGASNLNIFGSGIPNKTSRLYQALVEGDHAAAVKGSLVATIDPFLYTVRATVRGERPPERVLEVLDEELDRLRQEPIGAVELEKAIKQAKALFAYGSESITNQAFWLGYSEMFADHTWFESYLARLEAVTADQVLEIAQRYLRRSNRVVGFYLPTGEVADG
jgi:zinc protease